MIRLIVASLFVLCCTLSTWAVPMPVEIVASPAEGVSAGDRIRVYWRWRASGVDPISSTGYFDARDSLVASDGPGFLTGAAIHKKLRDVLKYPPKEVWAINVKIQEKPNECIPTTDVTDDSSDYYDNYVCEDEKGTVYIFLELVQQ
jgi:hypothetical protein